MPYQVFSRISVEDGAEYFVNLLKKYAILKKYPRLDISISGIIKIEELIKYALWADQNAMVVKSHLDSSGSTLKGKSERIFDDRITDFIRLLRAVDEIGSKDISQVVEFDTNKGQNFAQDTALDNMVDDEHSLYDVCSYVLQQLNSLELPDFYFDYDPNLVQFDSPREGLQTAGHLPEVANTHFMHQQLATNMNQSLLHNNNNDSDEEPEIYQQRLKLQQAMLWEYLSRGGSNVEIQDQLEIKIVLLMELLLVADSSGDDAKDLFENYLDLNVDSNIDLAVVNTPSSASDFIHNYFIPVKSAILGETKKLPGHSELMKTVINCMIKMKIDDSFREDYLKTVMAEFYLTWGVGDEDLKGQLEKNIDLLKELLLLTSNIDEDDEVLFARYLNLNVANNTELKDGYTPTSIDDFMRNYYIPVAHAVIGVLDKSSDHNWRMESVTYCLASMQIDESFKVELNQQNAEQKSMQSQGLHRSPAMPVVGQDHLTANNVNSLEHWPMDFDEIDPGVLSVLLGEMLVNVYQERGDYDEDFCQLILNNLDAFVKLNAEAKKTDRHHQTILNTVHLSDSPSSNSQLVRDFCNKLDLVVAVQIGGSVALPDVYMSAEVAVIDYLIKMKLEKVSGKEIDATKLKTKPAQALEQEIDTTKSLADKLYVALSGIYLQRFDASDEACAVLKDNIVEYMQLVTRVESAANSRQLLCHAVHFDADPIRNAQFLDGFISNLNTVIGVRLNGEMPGVDFDDTEQEVINGFFIMTIEPESYVNTFGSDSNNININEGRYERASHLLANGSPLLQGRAHQEDNDETLSYSPPGSPGM